MNQLVQQAAEHRAGSVARATDKESLRYMANDHTLLQKACALDPLALAQIHDAHYGAIFRYISFRVDDPRTVEDLTGEVFARFLAALRKRIGRPNSIRPWLFGAASRVVKEYYRRESRWNLVALDESIAGEQMGPDQAAEEMWTRRELREAIRTLTRDQQTVLALRFGANLPIKQVSALMSKSEGAVKMLQARAVSALARQMVERE